MSKNRIREQILCKNGFDFEAFKIENEHLAESILSAMDEYSEQNCDMIYDLHSRPTQKLKPLEDLYRKENPMPNGKYYIPDRTKFYEWIANKVLVVSGSLLSKTYEIDFGGNLKCKIRVCGNELKVEAVLNVWGKGIPFSEISVAETVMTANGW